MDKYLVTLDNSCEEISIIDFNGENNMAIRFMFQLGSKYNAIIIDNTCGIISCDKISYDELVDIINEYYNPDCIEIQNIN